MFDHQQKPPEKVKLGKAKAVEAMVLMGGVRLVKNCKVRYWVQRRGAREDILIRYNDRTYPLTSLEFKRRFKVLIKGGEVRIKPAEDEAAAAGSQA
jgi:hypothetical protein